ncbi:MAG: sigma factor [Candidatus Paceibacterota bacterium]
MGANTTKNSKWNDSALKIYRDQLTDARYAPATQEQIATWSHQAAAGDLAAKHRMIETNLRLAVVIALEFSAGNCAWLDLIQESNLALTHSVVQFEPEKGFRISTYAKPWIINRCRSFIRAHGRNVRIPVYIYEAARRYSEVITEVWQKLGRAPTHDEIVENVPVSRMKWLLMLAILQGEDSLDQEIAAANSDSDDYPHYPLDGYDLVADQSTLSPSSRLIAKEEFVELYSGWLRFNTVLEYRRAEEPESVRRLELKAGLTNSGVPTTLEYVGETCNPAVTREAIRISVRNSWRRLHSLGSPFKNEDDLIESKNALQDLLDIFTDKTEVEAMQIEAMKAHARWYTKFKAKH